MIIVYLLPDIAALECARNIIWREANLTNS